MSTTTARPVSRRPRKGSRHLIRRHFRQSYQRSPANHDQLSELASVTFRPCDRDLASITEPLRPMGTTALVHLSYASDTITGHRRIPIIGLKAEMTSDGVVTYGRNGKVAFAHNAARLPTRNSRGNALNAARNPALTELALQLDRACLRFAGRANNLPTHPELPRVLLGFAPDQPPRFEDTPELRRIAAAELDIPTAHLGANGDVLLGRLLHDVWERQQIQPDAPDNKTGFLLVDSKLCTQSHRSLREFEDFSGLLGAATWNPARQVIPATLPNPANQVLDRLGIARDQDFNQSCPINCLLTLSLP